MGQTRASVDGRRTAEGTTGLLIVGHGTRDPDGQAEFAALAARVRSRLPDLPCEACSLEFAAPSIAEGVTRLAERGVTHVIAMPLMLFAAGHVKQDIPAELARAAGRHAELRVQMTDYLGCHEKVIELSARRFEDLIERSRKGNEPIDPAQALLLMVGRGSRDPTATDEMFRFANLRAERTPVGAVNVCFTAMAEPSLDRGLTAAAESSWTHVIVQPHLLFRGELLDRVRHAVQAQQAKGDKRWTLTEHLGSDDLTVEAVLKIAGF